MGDAHQGPPGLPEVHDEAADTPMWVPAVGLALLVALALTFVFRGDDVETHAEPGSQVEAGEIPALAADE